MRPADYYEDGDILFACPHCGAKNCKRLPECCDLVTCQTCDAEVEIDFQVFVYGTVLITPGTDE